MLNLLRRRRGVPSELFYSYWSGAHMQLAARLPAIHQYWQHQLDFDAGRVWPTIPGIEHDLAEELRFEGDAEMTFLTETDYATYMGAVGVLMDDERNLFEETISYLAYGDHGRTLFDAITDPSPNGDQQVLKFMLYVRRADSVVIDAFHERLRAFAESVAGDEHVLRLRMRLVEEYRNEPVALKAPGVSNYKPPELQYQAGLEIAFENGLAFRRFTDGERWVSAVPELPSFVAAIHPFSVRRTYTVYNHGAITVGGLRSPAVAEQIRTLGAVNQLSPETVAFVSKAHPAG
jgi:hypothetical protein